MSFLTLAALKAFAGRIFKFLGNLNVWQILLLVAVAYAGIERIQLASERRHSAKVEGQLHKAIEGRKADRKAYEKAQKDAADLNAKQVQSIKQKQEAITDDVKSDLNSRLERIRSELRREQVAASQGAAKGSRAGDPSNPSCRAYDPTWMCLSPEDRLRAAENEERHDQLINWNERQSAVRP